MACRVEGWLRVCEVAVPQCSHSASADSELWAFIPWHPGFLVIRQDEKSLVCYSTEQAAMRTGRHLNRLRLDGGYRAFYRQWGYDAPPPLPENATLMMETVSLHDGLLALTSEDVATYDFINDLCGGTESLDRRLLHQRRIMAPVSESPSLAIMETPPTHQRLASFLSKQLPWKGLKRTKSVTKLDRNQRRALGTPFMPTEGLLVSPLAARPCASVPQNGYSTIRSSRSHESLSPFSTTTHMIELNSEDVTVQNLHGSVLGTPHCFQISTRAGATKYYACRSAAERERWLECLRQSMYPNQDQQKRVENSVQIWIMEAKGISPKRRYFCELCLDKTLYARTSCKVKGDMCFWGEYFEFSHLPKLDMVCVNLYREADRKKKKDRSTLIGFVNIPVSVLVSKQPVERWYPITGSDKVAKLDCPAIRIKARYQTLDILPLRSYLELLQLVERNYLPLCTSVESCLSVKAKEDLATSLVRIVHHQHKAKAFLCDLVMSEVRKLDNEHLMFRGNSLATKAVESYMKLVGEQYLQDTLGDFVRSLVEAEDDCEVDPVKVPSHQQLEKNQKTLAFYVEIAWGKIINSVHYFPGELRDAFGALRERLKSAGRSELSDNVLSSSIFLRFLCPAILSPSLFSLVSEYPSEKAGRALTLVAKSIQTLANFSQFGAKEHYMEFMNTFVHREWENMRQFLSRISTPVIVRENRIDTVGLVDLGKELCLLHSHLLESLPLLKPETSHVADLRAVLERVTESATVAKVPLCRTANNANGSPGLSPMSDYDNHQLDTRNNNARAEEGVLFNALNENVTVRRSGYIVQKTRQKHLSPNARPLITMSPSLEECTGSISDLANNSLDSNSKPVTPVVGNGELPLPPRKSTSQHSLVSSSGYQTVPSSATSSASSASPGAADQRISPAQALSFANPLYSAQTTPMIQEQPKNGALSSIDPYATPAAVASAVHGRLGRPAPRTNPHLRSPRLGSFDFGVPPPTAEKPKVRRAITDVELVPPGLEPADEPEIPPWHPVKSPGYLSELENMRRQLELAQEKLRDAEVRSRRPKLVEEVKPIINRLHTVQLELQDEVSQSERKQKIIEAQRRKIESLESANARLMATLLQLKEGNLDDATNGHAVTPAAARRRTSSETERDSLPSSSGSKGSSEFSTGDSCCEFPPSGSASPTPLDSEQYVAKISMAALRATDI